MWMDDSLTQMNLSGSGSGLSALEHQLLMTTGKRVDWREAHPLYGIFFD